MRRRWEGFRPGPNLQGCEIQPGADCPVNVRSGANLTQPETAFSGNDGGQKPADLDDVRLSRSGGGGLLFGDRFFAFEVSDAALAFLALVVLLAHKVFTLLESLRYYQYWNMKRRFHKFNIYLTLSALFLAGGCASERAKFDKEEQSTIRLYLEGNRKDTTGTGTVLVTRDRYPMTIERAPFLTEADLRQAALVPDPGPNGGYSIELVFNDHGSLMLDMLTTANRGRHIVIFSQFPHPGYKPPQEKKKSKKDEFDNENKMEDLQATLPPSASELEGPGQKRASGWLAAYLIRERDSSGIFRFSPDASREETQRIVRGLKNVIAYERSLELH
jgi:hypothetical protein